MARKTEKDKKYDELVKKIDALENKQTKKASKKKRILLAVGITAAPLAVLGISAGVIVATQQKTQTWTFTQSDYTSFRDSIISLTKQENFTYADFNSNLLKYTKQYLKASKQDISSLITNSKIIEKTDTSITFEVTLETNKNIYNCQTNEKFDLKDNKLTLRYFGDTNIEFPK